MFLCWRFLAGYHFNVDSIMGKQFTLKKNMQKHIQLEFWWTNFKLVYMHVLSSPCLDT